MSTKRLTITVEGPEIMIEACQKGLDESKKALVIPEEHWPGYFFEIVKEDQS